MTCRVEIPHSVQRELDALPDSVWKEAIQTISDLREDPFPEGAHELRGHRDYFRVKFYFDRYRIIYRVSLKQRRVVITRVGIRGTAYIGYQ